MKYFTVFQLLTMLILSSVSGAAEQNTMLPSIVLKGEDGGTTSGGEWNSSNLIGKTNLILYVDPRNKKKATPLIEKIDSLSYSPDTLGITFIVNTKAAPIPDLIIGMMIKRRAKKNKNIQYILDRNLVLIKKWDFTNENLNVLILDPSGKVLHKYSGEITEDYINKFIITLDIALQHSRGTAEKRAKCNKANETKD
jgi:predicted transcriptional regulator